MQLRPSSHALIIETSVHQFCDRANQQQHTAEVHVCREGVSVCSDSHHTRYEDILAVRAVANKGAGHMMKGNLGEGSRWNPMNLKLRSKESLQVFTNSA